MGRLRTLFILAGLALVPQLGCGRAASRPAASFSGVVTLDGKPLDSGSIHFTSLRSGEAAFTNLDSSGHYQVKFPEADLNSEYQVTVAPPMREEVDAIDALSLPAEKQNSTVPPRYANRGTSGLSAELKMQGENPANFALTTTESKK